jgi:hypothetical protein
MALHVSAPTFGQVRSTIEHDCLRLVRKVFIDAYYDFDDDQGAV